MSSKVISFRLSDAEVEALQALQTPEDDASLNQTAARLVRNVLGASTKPSTNVDIQELVKREVENAITHSEYFKNMIAVHEAYITTGINEIKREVDERLGKLKAR
ncbi:hypothetical protein BV372_06870 [Nostoc sp. T09]|uniref:hypothetical protein n=1 Tax=Nostoc sp. T09 TaxID=1932621 RepID=UPI000A3BA5CB|nr:hypothetical protein [Nostoc sp. T09]OUL36572.1 hypothetical protein BV372_06870 [Nostoc sp. T09]